MKNEKKAEVPKNFCKYRKIFFTTTFNCKLYGDEMQVSGGVG